MARELENINASGELEVIKLGGTADGNKLLTSDEIDTSIDNKIGETSLSKLGYGVFASLDSAADTTITTGGTYYPISGTFTNSPSVGFSTTADPAIQFTVDDTIYFEIDWHCTFSCSTSNSTISVGVGDTSSVYSNSVMQAYAKNVGQLYQLSGTLVVALNQNDKIQLLITSDTSADVITVNNFTTTIKAFII